MASGSGGSLATRVPAGASAFAWLHPAAAPASWHTETIPSGATLPVPPGWRAVRGDRGTATAQISQGGERVAGYLNLTPRQGAETLAGWARFRVAHNADEGDLHVTTLAAAGGLHFRTGHGSCVRDSYTTSSGASYVELACLIAGRRATSVVVAASPPDTWPAMAPVLERAVSAVTS